MTTSTSIPFTMNRLPDSAISAGWMALDDPASVRDLFGLPIATAGYRLIVGDGVLWVLTAKNEHGWTVAMTHTQTGNILDVIPGRMPTLDELRAACATFVEDGYAIMAALVEPMTQAMRERINRTGNVATGPNAPGLSTTVRCVQVFIEGITDDVVFGTAPA
jgi:hypothetical protein